MIAFNPFSPWCLAGYAVLLLCGLTTLLIADVRSNERARKVREVLRRETASTVRRRSPARALIGLLRRVGETLRDSALYSRNDIAELERTIAATGLDPAPTASALIGAKLLLFFVLPSGIYTFASVQGWTSSHQLAGTALAVPAALLLPNSCLNLLRRSYRNALQRALPDALDLMVVCAEAGLGFETALERVAREVAVSSRAVALELAVLENELRVASDRRQALTMFGKRTGLDAFRRLAATLLQTLHYGTPLAHGLRTLSKELRQERLTAFEEKAARLPALLVPPMILFIMPCLFIVLLGPSAVQLMSVLGRMSQ